MRTHSWLGWRVRRASGTSQGRKPGASYDARVEAGLQKILKEFYCESNPGVRIHTYTKSKKPQVCKPRAFYLAGMEGFEPPNARTKTWCLTTWRHPKIQMIVYHIIHYSCISDVEQKIMNQNCFLAYRISDGGEL